MAPEVVLDALKSVTDPDLHADIVALKFVKDVSVDGDRVVFTIESCQSVAGQARGARRAGARRGGGAARRDDRRRAIAIRGALGLGARARQAAAARRQECDCGRRRQGRRRQDHRCREPRRGAVEERRPRRHPRRRHLRTERADHARPAGAARIRRQTHPAGREIRPPGGVDGFSDAGRSARDLARADAAQRHPAVLPGSGVEGSRLSGGRHAAGHRRRGALVEPDRAGRRRDCGDDPAAGVARRQPPRGPHVSEAQHPAARACREHELPRMHQLPSRSPRSSDTAAANRWRGS